MKGLILSMLLAASGDVTVIERSEFVTPTTPQLTTIHNFVDNVWSPTAWVTLVSLNCQKLSGGTLCYGVITQTDTKANIVAAIAAGQNVQVYEWAPDGLSGQLVVLLPSVWLTIDQRNTMRSNMSAVHSVTESDVRGCELLEGKSLVWINNTMTLSEWQDCETDLVCSNVTQYVEIEP